jgi:iron complex transport system substrate-binding protein
MPYDNSPVHGARRRRARVAALAMAALVVAAACGSDTDTDTSTANDLPTTTAAPATTPAAFPVTVSHAFGETTISEEPARVVTWGWASTDAAIALGVVPAAMPFQAYGGDEQGVLPWIRERLEADGAEIPAVLPEAQEPPFEAIAAADPDLILAVYSGITEEEYGLLSQIAPTVAYPDQPWATPWRGTVQIVGRSLGRATQADELLASIDQQVASAAAAHPELAGKSVAMVWPSADTFYVYKPADARVAFTLDLGLVSAPSVDTLASGDSSFFYTLSQERLGELTSDILVAYADTAETLDAYLASPAGQLLPQTGSGSVAKVIGTEFIAAVSPPTALSLTWGLDEYVTLLSEAAKAAG